MQGRPTYEEMENRIQKLEKEWARFREVKQALQESEKRLNQIIQGSPIPAFVMDKTHVITHCNRAYERLRGLPARDIIGTHGGWLQDSGERPFMADYILEQAPEEEMVWYYGGRCRKSRTVEGAYEADAFFPEVGPEGRWMFVTAAPILDTEGNVTGAIETLQDITERRQTEEALKESEKKLSQIVQGSPIPTFVVDNNHMVTHMNRALEKLRGIQAHEIVGTRDHWVNFYAYERPVMADLIVDGAPEAEMFRYYGKDLRKSQVIENAYESEAFFPGVGEKGRWLYFTAAPLTDDEGRIVGAIETLQDVTQRKAAEEEMRRSERRYRMLLNTAPYPIVVFTLEGFVVYLNPAFTETFGWTLEELEGKRIPYVPPGLEQETADEIRRLIEQKVLLRRETKRLTRDGRVLDVTVRAVIFSEGPEDEPAGELVILRDITHEKRTARQNEAMLRISMALPRYPDLEDLLEFINTEVKDLLGTEGAIVVLLDEHKQELFVLGAAYDDSRTQERIKEFRFSMDQLIAGRVIRSGQPMIVSDTSVDRELHEERDRRFGYKTRNLLLVPLQSAERTIGALCAINKKEGDFEKGDEELLSTVAATVALSIENARFSEELKKAYREVTSLNRAKDKAINHISHELKTPVSIVSGSLSILAKRLGDLPEKTWKQTLERLQRNLERIVEIQYEAADIMENRPYRAEGIVSLLLEQCADELETLVAQETGEGPIVERIRKRIREIFEPREAVPREILLHEAVGETLEAIRPRFSHREVEVLTHLQPAPSILIPPDVLQKVIEGLVKNAVENTPDEGKIEIGVRRKGEGAELLVQDYGVGIPEEAQRRIFEGLFTTRDTLAYSSKRPFDFNAGGKGADLLRMKIFSERYHFQIQVRSTRCPLLAREDDVCPGRISECPRCKSGQGCHRSGATLFSVYFPPAHLAGS
ncbi:MAG: PAS domain S-box protein [Thermodesulfobacteriota bacterium]